MTRPVGAGVAAHIATRSHSRATMILFILADGTAFGVTDHDQDIEFELTAADLGEAVTYESGTGILRSDIKLTADLNADNCEIEGPIADTVTLSGLLGGRYNRARVFIYEVNWKSPANSVIPLLAGNVTDARPEGGRFVFEIRSDFDRYNQVVGEIITNSCKVDFGSAKCGVVPEEIVGTVTAGDALSFNVSFSGSYADAYFNQGVVIPLTGVNAGGSPVEIFGWDATGDIILFCPLADIPEVGDTFTIRRGCSKLRMSDDPTIPTCLTYGNVINFRGYPEVPGSDKVLKMPVPGQGNEDD